MAELPIDSRRFGDVDRKSGIPQGEWRLDPYCKSRVQPAIPAAHVGPHFRGENGQSFDATATREDEVILAVDAKVDRIFDLDDATKVRCEGNHVVEIGKDLSRYNALDTGMFLCSPALFSCLESAKKNGDCSLSDGMRKLAQHRKLRAFDIDDGNWQDVDSPQALEHVERIFERDFCGSRRRAWSMLRIPPAARLPLRILSVFMGAALFGYLIWQAGPGKLWENAVRLGWGFVWVLAAAGISHVFKAWAWRLTLDVHKHKISFPRLLGLRLGAEAAGQLGFVGQTFGDSVRVAHLSPDIPKANGYASVTLDRGLYFATGIIVLVAGLLGALPLLSHSRALRLYASLFALALITALLVTLLAVRKRWPVISEGALFLAHVPFLKRWIETEYVLIQSVENALLDFSPQFPRSILEKFFSDPGVSFHGRDGGLFSSPSHGSEIWPLERLRHRSDDQTCECGRQRQPRKFRNLRGWKHTDRQDVRPEYPHGIDVGTSQADAGTFLDRRRRDLSFHFDQVE